MKGILIANGTSENHGCEAIMQTTARMLSSKLDKLYCSTTNLKYECTNTTLPEKCEWVEYSYYRKPTLLNRGISKIEKKVLRTNSFEESRPWLKNVFATYDDCDIVLSGGGDNYCNGSYEWLYQLNDEARRKGLKTILWGASLSENTLNDKRMIEDLKAFDTICVRESLSYEMASQFHSNVKLYPDPAFSLEKDMHLWPVSENGKQFDESSEFIGINASPTTISCESEKGILLNNYEVLIEFILKNTDYNIALIPHVIYQKKYGDYEVLQKLYEKYKDSNRMVLIGDNNCKVLKGYISKCRCFITARTHASIAAYSSNVPCLVLGYSMKARGIAKDLFGDLEHYVIPVQRINSNNEILKDFIWLEDHHDQVKNSLANKMDEYKKRALDAVEVV